MSLRARLVWTTAILVAAGLTVSGIATYLLVRNFLVSRVDEQLQGARPLAAQLLHSEGSYPPYPSGRRGGGGGRGPDLPATFVMLLDPSGDVVETRTVGLRSIESPPVLPTPLPGSRNAGPADSLFLTAQDPEGSSTFRVLAFRDPGQGGTVVVAQPLDDVNATISRLLLIEGFVGLAVMAAGIATALWLIRLNLQPLNRMERTAADIAAGDLSRRVDTDSPDTEVGRLGQALNAMLERIESAFEQRRESEDKLRRFVADASHELRTPLTSIRGYAELFRSGASSNPDDLAKSMRRIEEESARMAKLVDEMLLLARLDQDPQLNLDEVDLGTVVGDVVHDARTVHPDTPITFAADEDVVVVGDDTRLRQV
ncbi:MAG TPA: HAMP domain-containing sensor histidine kinase, partial [Actinomycetota bacterium]|nr:HAMP domain-containing sensor histidine kinase [Actinomycetota bacterium]